MKEVIHILIYLIRNTLNGKVYIGQTTKSLHERKLGYSKEIKKHGAARPIIWAMRKYGLDAFSFEVLKDDIYSKEELDNWERYYIKKYHSLCSENGYNLELGGNGVGKHSEETKRKISIAQIGPKNHMYGKTGERNVTSKAVVELTSGKIYPSAMIAAKSLNLSNSHISSVCRGERGSTGGYVFRYLEKNGEIVNTHSHATIKSVKLRDYIEQKYGKCI